MSGLTPRRLRTKTSDFTEFFRATNLSSSSQHPDNDISSQSQATTYTLDVPSTSTQSPGLIKKKLSKIPFLGRSRKKSNTDTGELSVRDSSDVGDRRSSATTSTDRRATVEIQGEPSLPPPRLSILVAPSPVKPPSQSLGLKLAAHFQPRTRKLSALASKPPMEPTRNDNSLAPPEMATRGASLDSGSSGGRSPTPRAQPTITVSFSPEDNLNEYKDLFTLPRQKKAVSPDATPRQSNTPESSEESPNGTPVPPTTSRIPSPIPPHLSRKVSAPTLLEGSHHRISKNPIPEQPSKPPPKPSSRKTSGAEKGSEDSSITLRSSDGKDSTRSSHSDKLSGPSLQRRVSVTPSTPAADYSAQQRLRMRQQSPATERRNRPPSMPLPSTPGAPPSPSIPSVPMSRTLSAASVAVAVPVPVPKLSRPRASTVGSVSSIASSPLSQSAVPSDAQTTEHSESRASPSLNTEIPAVDLSLATVGQLRELLDVRTQQYDELASYVLTVTEKHAIDKAALEKKVSQLEREMAKKDNQIKGLMWLVANNKSPPATDFPPNLTLPALPSTKPTTDHEAQKTVSRMPLRRHRFSDDSGAESHPTSGAESIRTSETSGNESGSYRRSKGRRPFMLGDSSYNFYRAAVGKRIPPPNSLAPDSALPELPNKRSSLTMVSPSPSSSTSSLLPPSPSLTVSSLSAIPEAPSSFPRSMQAGDSADGHEERRSMRASHRISTSSLASSSTAASSAYASNLKRSRPPSIAQVLENSPSMDDALEKLRPFQPTS